MWKFSFDFLEFLGIFYELATYKFVIFELH